MKKPAIPQAPRDGGMQRAGFDGAVKETLEILTGRRGGKVQPLPETASTDDIIAKVNEIIDRMQG